MTRMRRRDEYEDEDGNYIDSLERSKSYKLSKRIARKLLRETEGTIHHDETLFQLPVVFDKSVHLEGYTDIGEQPGDISSDDDVWNPEEDNIAEPEDEDRVPVERDGPLPTVLAHEDSEYRWRMNP